ncbi:MAG: hypothetical protein R8K46_10715 [Mariprofundaceae bacterium]
MRRLAALLMAFTLICVTSLPLISEAAVCVHELARQMSVDHAMAGSMAKHDHAMMHDHEAPMVGAMLDCRLECGCGCHDSIDGLPHVLAPHVFETACPIICNTVARASGETWPAVLPFFADTLNPPPKNHPSDLV